MPNLSQFKNKGERAAWYRGYRAKRREFWRDYNREYNKGWRKVNGYHNEKQWKEENPVKVGVQKIAQNAKKKGLLIPKPCEMCLVEEGKTMIIVVMHHDDYSKPLEVRWLCHIHHREVHYEAVDNSDK